MPEVAVYTKCPKDEESSDILIKEEYLPPVNLNSNYASSVYFTEEESSDILIKEEYLPPVNLDSNYASSVYSTEEENNDDLIKEEYLPLVKLENEFEPSNYASSLYSMEEEKCDDLMEIEYLPLVKLLQKPLNSSNYTSSICSMDTESSGDPIREEYLPLVNSEKEFYASSVCPTDETSSNTIIKKQETPLKQFKSSSSVQCMFCEKKFATKLQLDSHLLSKHKEIPEVEYLVSHRIHYCKHCKYRTVNGQSLASHIVSKHKNKQLPKKYLHYLHASAQSRDFACTFCNQKFAKKLYLDSHFLSKHKDIPNVEYCVSNKIYYCKYCNYRTINNHHLASHSLSKHTFSDIYKDKESSDDLINKEVKPQKKFKSSIKSHDFACTFCGKKFAQKIHMDSHFLSKHQDMPNVEYLVSNKIHYCEHCNYRTINNHYLASHTLTQHTFSESSKDKESSDDVKIKKQKKIKSSVQSHNFTCMFCEKKFLQKLTMDSHFLTKHRYIPDVEYLVSNKIHYCKICNYRTINSHSLASHTRSKHTNFTDAQSKKQHLPQVKQEKQSKSLNTDTSLPSRYFACILCNQKFAQKLHMDSHLLTKHKEIPNIENLVSNKIHYCKHCNYRTINSHNLVSHTRSKHKKVQIPTKYLYCFCCNYSTYNKGNLVTHCRRHANVKLFHCQYCERSYNQKGNLDTHYLRSHRNESEVVSLITSKVYGCKLCEFKTLSKRDYLQHISNCCKKDFYMDKTLN